MVFKSPKTQLNESQYYKAVFPKKFIFLHHTAGTTAEGAISWWNSKPDHVATPFIIERDGTILQLFDPKYWSYALGIKGGTDIERASIQIELVAAGKLEKKEGKFYMMGTKHQIPTADVVEFKAFYRDCYYYHKYTDAQIASLVELLPYLVYTYNIKVQCPFQNFWYYDKNWLSNKPLDNHNGIWSHSTIRPDKSDIMPQKELITALYSLNI